MVFGGGRKQKELEAAAERARKEVLFWKDQLDHAVNEKKSLLERYTELYRHSFELEQAVVSLNTENTELRHVLDRTVVLHDERKTVGGAATPTSETGASTPDGRQLQHYLANTQAALKQADVRIAILEERNITLQQESDLLHKQNELLRSSEAAYQKEAQLLREELSNARGINDLTADETTKLLLENSRLQQALVAARSEGLHKDEMLRLLSAEINELNSRLELYASACQSVGLDVGWDGLVPESSSDRLDLLTAAGPVSLSQGGTAAITAATATAARSAEGEQADGQLSLDSANATGPKTNSSSAGVSAGGSSSVGASSGGAEPGSAEAAVEALAAQLPLKLSGLNMLRTSTQDRKGTFSGQPITPRDMAEAKQKLAEQEGKQHSAAGGPLSARPPRQTPRSSRGVRPGAVQLPPIPPAVPAGGLTALVPSPKTSRANGSNVAGVKQQKASEELHVVAGEKAIDEDDEGMLQGSPNLAEVQQRSLVRHATPALALSATAATASTSAGDVDAQQPANAAQVALCEAAAMAAVTAAVRSSLNSLPSSPTKQHNSTEDGGSTNDTPDSPSKMGSLATAVAATAAKALLAAGAVAELSAAEAVNEFKLAACAAPPAEPMSDEDGPAAEPVELSELEPGIPQRQQALARLAAGQQQPAKSSSGRRLAVAQAEGVSYNPAVPSPRTNLAEAMSNPAALVAAAAAAGVLDAPEGVSVPSEAAAAGGTAAAGLVVCQRQAALARLAAERESRLLQEQKGSSGGARSRSSSPADAGNASNQRRTSVTRMGLTEGGSSGSSRVSADGAAGQDASAPVAAAAAPVARCNSDVTSHVLTEDPEDEGGDAGDAEAATQASAAAVTQAASANSGTKDSSQSSSTEHGGKPVVAVADAANQPQSSSSPPADDMEIKPLATDESSTSLASRASGMDSQRSGDDAQSSEPAAAAAKPSADSGMPATAAPAAVPAIVKAKDSESLPRSNSLKERIAAMNALNLPQPLGSPRISENRSGGGSSSSGGGGSRCGGGVVARYLQAEHNKQQQQSQGGSSSGGGAAAISRIPSGPLQKSKVPAAVSKIPSKIPSAPDASAGGSSSGGGGVSGGGMGCSRSASPSEQQAADNGNHVRRRVSSGSIKGTGAKVDNKSAAAASKTCSSNGPSRTSSGDVVVEVSAAGRAAAAAAPSKAAGTKGASSTAAAAVENDVNTKDDSSAPAAADADTWKPTPVKRQLSDRMAAMRAAFEGNKVP